MLYVDKIYLACTCMGQKHATILFRLFKEISFTVCHFDKEAKPLMITFLQMARDK